jgi:hypothetical protein
VPAGHIHNASAAEGSSHAARHLPRFVQLLAGQTAGATDRTRDPVEQRAARESIEVVPGQTIT